VAHGNMTVVVSPNQVENRSGSEAGAAGDAANGIKPAPGNLLLLPKAASLSEVIRALNAIGATPKDLLAILQAMKSAGALHAELEII